MPDVKSIALGGGSLIQWDPQKVRGHSNCQLATWLSDLASYVAI